MNRIEHALLLRLIQYNKSSGVFTWIHGHQKIKAGSVAGTSDKDGYIIIQIQNKLYKAHRLAWFYVNQCWPGSEIDHINGDPSDNRISNIRECDRIGNSQNRRISTINKSGHKGVYMNHSKTKWIAAITYSGTRKIIGSFLTKEQASHAYVRNARVLHGEFFRATK